MHLSILIRNYNEAADLEKTLLLIRKQQVSFAYEIVVSDNQSTDNSVAVAEALGCRVVHNNAAVFSYGQLLNFGIEHCNGEFILLLSAHIALLNSDAIENILQPFADAQVACVSGTPATSISMIMDTLQPKQLTIADFTSDADWKNKDNRLFAAPCGAIRKSVWGKIKFSEELEIMEDRYWNRCVLEAGYKSVYGINCFYLYFIVRTPATNRKRIYMESLAHKRIYGKAERIDNFYIKSLRSVFSQAWHNIMSIPLDLANLLKIYAVRFKKKNL